MQNQQAASHIALSMDTYKDIARYDAAAKNLFRNKKVLAYILKYCAIEFKDCSLEAIEKLYIEGNISVSEVGVEPDTTHTKECTESEYSIPMTVDSKEGNDMCNLGEGIFNRGVQQGVQQGIQQGVQQGTVAESKNGIRKLVQSLRRFDIPEAQILEEIKEKYELSQQEAQLYLNTIS